MENDNRQLMIPYVAYESMLAKEDLQQKRMIYVIILLIVLLLVTNIIWIVAWNQYDYVDDYTSVDGGNGVANYIGDDGDIYNGTDSTQSSEENTQ